MNLKGSIYKQEFIGNYAEVVESNHQGYRSIKGKVVDETKNTIHIKNRSGSIKMIPKKGNTFNIKIDDQEILVKGNKIKQRPEDRIKKAG